MLYVYYGSDIRKSIEKARVLVNSLRTKRPDATYIEIVSDNWSSAIVEENIGGQGLFSNKYIIFLNRVTENNDAKENLSDYIQDMNDSTNIFIILEEKLNAELKKVIEKYSEKIVETGNIQADFSAKSSGFKKATVANDEFNVFALADALGSRNSLKSWNLYRQAVDNGLEIESIIGTLFWQVKSMIVAQKSSSASISGLSPFVYSKAKKNAENYSEKELGVLLRDLIKIYHDGHRGIISTELAIEKLMLGLKK